MSAGPQRLTDLVTRFGSPLYVYDLDQVTAAWDALRDGLPPAARAFYSMKANPHPAIAAHLNDLGARVEVSSLGELRAAVAAGFTAARTLMTGPAKTDRVLDTALAIGCRLFSVESGAELARLDAAATARRTPVTALMRVNVDDIVRSAGLSFGGVPSQFGTDLSLLVDAVSEGSLLTSQAVRIAGAHFFLATNLADEAALVANLGTAIAAAARLERAGMRISVLDLGGGFGAPYGKEEPLPSYLGLRDRLTALLADVWPRWPDHGPELWFESGRYLVATAGTLAATVVEVKQSKGERFVILDSGIHHLGGMAGLRRLPQLDVEVCPAAAGRGGSPQPVPARVVGPLCSTLDSWSLRAPSLRDVRPGDIVYVPNVGAYGLSASLLAFLSHECPVEVVISVAGGVHGSRLVIDRRTVKPAVRSGKKVNMSSTEPFTLRVSEIIDDAANLNCDNANISALAQYYGIKEPSSPVGCQWHFSLPRPGQLPVILRIPALRSYAARTGLVFRRSRPTLAGRYDQVRRLVRNGVPVMVYGNQFNMKWVPYYRNDVASHPFIVDGLDLGRFHVLEAYWNNTDWGECSPSELWITEQELADALETLEGPLRGVMIYLVRRCAALEVDPIADIRANAADIVRNVGDLDGIGKFSRRFRRQSADWQAMKLYDLSVWDLTRSRSCHLRWLRSQSALNDRIPAGLVDRFEAEVVLPWRRALQFAHLGFKRVQAGAKPPMVSFDLLEKDIAAAEVSLARQMLDQVRPGVP